MIRIFRNVRKTLITENRSIIKNTNYFKYAIGEILLVVAGILIALQFNTWHENHRDQKLEEVYLKNLKEDLVTQMHNFDYYIEFQDLIIRNANEIIGYFNSDSGIPHTDSIYGKLNDLAVRITFINSNTTLIELINSGEINLIRNDALKRELLEFNNSLTTVMNIAQNNNTNLIDRLVVPVIIMKFGSYGYSDSLYETISRNLRANAVYPTVESLTEQMDISLNEPAIKLELINSVIFRRGIAISQRADNVNLRESAEKLFMNINRELENH